MIMRDIDCPGSLLQKRFVGTPRFFLGTDQKVIHSYKKCDGTVAVGLPLKIHFLGRVIPSAAPENSAPFLGADDAIFRSYK